MKTLTKKKSTGQKLNGFSSKQKICFKYLKILISSTAQAVKVKFIVMISS